MRVEIYEKSYSAGDRLKRIIDKKLSRFDRYFDDDASCKVVLRKEGKDTLITEVSIAFAGKLVRSEVASDNMYDNVDLVIPKLERQLIKNKARLGKRLRETAFTEEMPPEDAYSHGKLVKTKNFTATRMSVDDAITELELLGHDFYVFLNAETGRVATVYKRNDGNYGMLDPIY